MTVEHELWAAPFEDAVVRDVGCPPRPTDRLGNETEVPWVLEFPSDNGSPTLFDRTMMRAVSISDHRYDVLVTEAWVGDAVGCNKCFTAGAGFLIIRSLEG